MFGAPLYKPFYVFETNTICENAYHTICSTSDGETVGYEISATAKTEYRAELGLGPRQWWKHFRISTGRELAKMVETRRRAHMTERLENQKLQGWSETVSDLVQKAARKMNAEYEFNDMRDFIRNAAVACGMPKLHKIFVDRVLRRAFNKDITDGVPSNEFRDSMSAWWH